MYTDSVGEADVAISRKRSKLCAPKNRIHLFLGRLQMSSKSDLGGHSVDRSLDSGNDPGQTQAQQRKEISRRHGLWLNRGRAKKGQKLITLRLVPRYRVGAKKALRAWDSQLRVGTASGGLKIFQHNPDKDVWHPTRWDSWPYLAMNLDLASDNVCGYYYGERELHLNSDLFGDGAHGCNRDVFGALDLACLKQFWQVMQISMNMPFGPMDNDEWGNMLDDVVELIKRTYARHDLPLLFRKEAPKMLRQLRNAGIELPGLEDPEMELFDYCMEAGLRRKAGSKITAARFCGSIAAAKCNVEHWAMDKVCRTANKL